MRWPLATTIVAVLCVGALASAGTRSAAPEALGAIEIPFAMPEDGEATVALYTPKGQVVRILAQLLELDKGDYTIRWDGMDLWGKTVPAGTELTVKVFTSPGLKAFYEFTVGSAGKPPWLTRPTGEGAAMRTGGWMGDHTPPKSALAFGDRVFFGCECAEHGHALIATNLEGEKLWGRGGLSGWRGPTFLATDGKMIYGVAGRDNLLYRIDPQSYEAERIHETDKDKVVAMAAHNGQVALVLRNHKARQTPFKMALGKGSFDYDKCRPLIPKGWKAVDHQIGPRDRFATVFYNGRHGQTGLRAVRGPGMAYVLVKLAKPEPVGTLILDRLPGVAAVDIYTLKPGVAYDPKTHEPGEALDISAMELEADWTLFGKTTFPHPLALLPAPKAGMMLDTLLIRFIPPPGSVRDFRPDVGMLRILRRRVQAREAACRVALPAKGMAKAEPQADKTARAWHFRMEYPISEAFPAPVVLDLGKPVTFEGLCMLGGTNPAFAIDALKTGRDPARANDADWEEAATFAARRDRRMGWETARARHKETLVPLFREVTTGAVRLRYTMGYGGGKWAKAGGKDDPTRVDCDHVAFLKLLDDADRAPTHLLHVRNGTTGELIRESAHPSVALAAMVYDADGTLYTLADGKLCRSRITDGKVAHTVLNDKELDEPTAIAVSADRIAVGDSGRHAVLLFDKQGKLQAVAGGKGPRVRGPWNPEVVERPTGVAIDAKGKLWVAERLYAPKRISRYAADGTFEKEFLGPAEYGGGGFLDPDLESFYYRSMHFALDWEKGTSRLKNLNDRLYTEETPTLDPHSFAYTKVGRPIVYKGRRYIVGDPGHQGSPGIVVCILDDDAATWRPCAVMANAHGSPFLLKKEVWRKHWLRKDLTDRCFIWCDRNGDGAYQVDEVEIFSSEGYRKGPFETVYWCNWIGPDLTFWGAAARLAPSRVTDKGVPIYESKNLQPFSYGDVAPTYTASMRYGMRAKPGPGATSIVLSDGSLILEGQPYLVQPDLEVLGGKPNAKRTDYTPPIHGAVLDNPLHFVGTAVTTSQVGEVAVVLGNSGRWFVESARDRVIVGRFFTGNEGGWGTDLPDRRGTDVTGRRLGSECFFGHFIKASNGNYYTVAGHGFHALSRIEGLDAIAVAQSSLTVPADSLAANRKIRSILRARESAAKVASKKKRSHTFRRIDRRTTRFKLDGEVDDWGGSDKMVRLGDRKDDLFFDGACDEDGLILAYAGLCPLGNASENIRFLFKTGFCLDLRYRTDLRSRSRGVVAGDRRIVFANHRGKWVAVLYDYIDPAVPSARWVEFASPWVSTRVARVVELPANACTIRFHVADGLLREAPKGKAYWSAEVRITWDALGLKPDKKLTVPADFGVLVPDSGGMRVAKRAYWSQQGELTVSDLGVEAMLNPGAWGSLTLEP